MAKHKIYPDFSLCGRMRSGKDSIADYLIKEFGYKKLSFAQALKEEVSKAVGCTVEEMNEEPLRSQIRPVLQVWGTEFRRNQNPDYWVAKLRDKITDSLEVTPYVVTDVRFLNEIEMLRSYEFVIVHVDMDEEETIDYLLSQGKELNEALNLLRHPSENEWKKAVFDERVESVMGDLPYLFRQIANIVNPIGVSSGFYY